MQRFCFVVGLMVAASFVLCAATPLAAQGSRSQVLIEIDDNAFQPANVTIPVGSTVRWLHVGENPHTVSSTTGFFESGTMTLGQNYALTFPGPGTFCYFCRFHPHEMRGTITVR
jgi:plastocyanin